MAGLSLFAEKSYPWKKGRGRRLQPFSHNAMKTEFETATTDLARRVPPHSVEAERAVLAGLILRPSAMGQIAPMLHPERFLPARASVRCTRPPSGFTPITGQWISLPLRNICAIKARWNRRAARLISRIWRSRMSARQTPSIMPSSYATNPSSAGSSKRGLKIVSTGFDTSKGSGRAHRRGRAIRYGGIQPHQFRRIPAGAGARGRRGGRRAQTRRGGDHRARYWLSRTRRHHTGAPAFGSDHHRGAPCDGRKTRPFALNLAMRAAISEGAPVGIFSLEMSEHQLVQRMISLWGKIPQEQLSTGRLSKAEGARFFETADLLRTAPLFINETPAISTLELRSQGTAAQGRARPRAHRGRLFATYALFTAHGLP